MDMKTRAGITVAGVLAAVLVGTSPGTAEAASLSSRALKVAAAQKNDRYQWGAEGPSRFDCSGLVWYSYKRSGKTLPRTAQGQYNKRSEEHTSELQSLMRISYAVFCLQ